MITVAVSGGFDKLHEGHRQHFKAAKKLGDKLVVIVNTDEFLLRKKGYIEEPLEERISAIRDLRYVDEVVVSIDKDQTVAETLKMLKPDIFAKGGDREASTMPQAELIACNEIGCKIVYGVHGKILSSQNRAEELAQKILNKPKILYVCPFAHYAGHHPHVATEEPKRFRQNGSKVGLITFNGTVQKVDTIEPHYTAIQSSSDEKLCNLLRRIPFVKWILMMIETDSTLIAANRIAKQEGYNVIYVRDGDPFLPLSFFEGMFSKGKSWVISLTAASVFAPKATLDDYLEHPKLLLHNLGIGMLNCPAWKWFYKWCLKSNKFTLVTQNKIAQDKYEQVFGGVFKGYVHTIPTATTIEPSKKAVSKLKAREMLNIPSDMFVALSIGAAHAGKDIPAIFEAIGKIPNVYLIHAGTNMHSLSYDPFVLARKYGIENRVMINPKYVTDYQKPYLFGASDVTLLAYTKAFGGTASMLWETCKYNSPVIASDANTLGEDVEKYKLGTTYEVEDAGALARAILAFKIPENLEQNTATFLRENSPEKWVTEHLELFRKAIGNVNK